VKLHSRLRYGVALAALCGMGAATQADAAAVQHPPLTGPYCSGGVSISGPGSTAQVNAIPGFDSVLAGGGAVDVLGNILPGCAESVADNGGGSGAGVTAAVSHSAPISFSDDPLSLSNQALAIAGGGTNASPINDVPVAILPVSVIVNLSCYAGNVKLSQVELGKMYDGAITTWDNKVLNVDNPGISTACAGVHINLTARADSSGTTFVFKSYLAHLNPEYEALKQDALNTTWLGHIACRGAGTGAEISCVFNTPDSVGYAASSNARAAAAREARVDNLAHSFATWTSGACSTSALLAPIPPSTLLNWSTVDFTDEPVGYGICGYTYDMAFSLMKTAFSKNPGLSSPAVTQTVVDWLTVTASNFGQSTLPTSQYDRLPIPTQKVAALAPFLIAYK
jgi:ABC-type phosphate transport system substrate-binding protein